ncbi:hypothetical protein GCM10008014_39130 [Paenibacillus silvae]|uniref:Uncharacterized protein n=1 Tax=Paenibacillus silvae TaxID=1325358 RepID=A0ABQ1ZHR1_9BACL|nr:hypothetical protein GCM10008014_39130 [Paenibacillus silvae]
MANAVNNALVAALGKTDRGVKKAPSQRGGTNIHVIDPKNTKAWAILPEMLFIDTASAAIRWLLINKRVPAQLLTGSTALP